MNVYEPPVEILQKINPLLQEELAYNDIEKLKKQLAELEAIRYDLSYNRCQWFQKMLQDRQRMLMPKDAQYTELDRKTMLDASTSVVEADYQFLVSLEKIIEDRLELGISFLQTL